MEKAKVFLLEVDEGIMKMAVAALKSEGHQAVLTANDYFQAQHVYQLALDGGVNVAVIDSSQGYSQEIANLVKLVNPDIKIVAFGWYQGPDWGNAWVDKSVNPGGLGKVVTQL